MSRLATQSELDKLGWTLNVDPDALSFLDDVAADQLRGLRIAINDHFDQESRVLIRRMSGVARRLPIPLTLKIAERLGPLLTAQVATEMPATSGAKIAARMSTGFAADVCVYLDPRRARDLITRVPTTWTVEVSLELARRGDFVTMSRFVDTVSDDAVRGVVDAVDDEASLLRVAYYMDSKSRMDHFFGMLSPKRLEALVLRVEEEPDALLPALLSLLIHSSSGLKRELGDIVAAQDESVLAGYVRATQRLDLWPDILPAVVAMSKPLQAKVVNLEILIQRDIQTSIVRAADEFGLWGALLPLVEMMNGDRRAVLAEIIAGRGLATLRAASEAALMGEHWEALLDLGALMPPARQDELMAMVRSFGEVDPDLLERVGRLAAQRGYGGRFEVGGAAQAR